MEAKRFRPNDPLYRAVLHAQRTLSTLQSELIAIMLADTPPNELRQFYGKTAEEYLNRPPSDYRREARKQHEREKY